MPLRTFGTKNKRMKNKNTTNDPAPHANSFISGAIGFGPALTGAPSSLPVSADTTSNVTRTCAVELMLTNALSMKSLMRT